jgi:tetratricopeptide (TPR) repeat protein
MKTRLSLMGAAILSVTMVFAQSVDRQREFPVRGEITSTKPLVGALTVELSGGSGSSETTTASSDGTFEFRSAPAGSYELRVLGPGGEVLHQEMVFINGATQSLSIRLTDNTANATRTTGLPSANRSTDNTISIQQLSHKVPPQAKKAFDRGIRAESEGNHQVAAEAFREAVGIDPEYVDALNELGAAEAALGELADAAQQFQKAVDLAPEHPLALPNLSIVLAKLRRFHDAAIVARRALKIVPDSGRIHYILAACILVEVGDTDEALENLERSTNEVPKAHLVAADLLVNRGRTKEAIKHLEEYLRVAPPGDADRDKAEARLAVLRH